MTPVVVVYTVDHVTVKTRLGIGRDIRNHYHALLN
jgi:hypothetical protein